MGATHRNLHRFLEKFNLPYFSPGQIANPIPAAPVRRGVCFLPLPKECDLQSMLHSFSVLEGKVVKHITGAQEVIDFRTGIRVMGRLQRQVGLPIWRR